MTWKAGLYGRVSTEHEEQQESIIVQKGALTRYALENNFEVAGYYFDEGYTGTNFERPQMMRLKNDIENNIINLVIVKDLSRIGRNNALTLLFLEFLEERKARLISLNDNYDTFKDEDDLIGIKTWFNERYSKELSQKIRFALRHKKKMGEYIATYAPYGYKKSLKVKNKLEIDCFAAEIVKEIFNLYLNGYGFAKIARTLQQREIPNPSRYGSYSRVSDKWDWTTIKRILTNPVYMGNSVQQRYCRKSFKSKKMCKTPSSQWIEVLNTHEPIISPETFSLTQNILKKRKENAKYRCGQGKPHLFSSFLYCHECKSALYYKKDKNGQGVYRCGNYVKYGRRYCTSHFIREEELKIIVGHQLMQVLNNYLNNDGFIKEIENIYCSNGNKGPEGKLQSFEEQILKNKAKIEILYKDRLNGIISEPVFLKLRKELQLIIMELEKKKTVIYNEIKNYENIHNFRDFFKEKIAGILRFDKGIDREILERFVKRIEIFEDGSISIEFNFTTLEVQEMES